MRSRMERAPGRICSRIVYWLLHATLLLIILPCKSTAYQLKASRFDIVQDRTLQSEIELTLDMDIGATATNMCNSLFYDARKVETNRCITMALHTMRDHKTAILRDELSSAGVAVVNEAASLALQYAYDERSQRYLGTSSRICAVGYPSLDAVKIIMSSKQHCEMLYFLPPIVPNDSDLLLKQYRQQYGALASAANRTVYFIHGDAQITMQSLQSASRTRLCDFIHFQSVAGAVEPLTLLEIQALVSIVDLNGGAGINAQVLPPLRVAWVRDIDLSADLQVAPLMSIEGNEYAPYASTVSFSATSSLRSMNGGTGGTPLPCSGSNSGPGSGSGSDPGACAPSLQWQLSSIWMDTCRIDAVGNYDGFTGRTYHNRGHRLTQLQEVLIGRVQVQSAPAATAEAEAPMTAFAPPLSGLRATVVAITYTIRVFGETASGLRAALQALGYQRVYLVPDMTVSAVEYLQSLCSSSATWDSHYDAGKCTVLQIALGPHDISLLTAHYVVFQMEQVWSPIAFAGPYKLRYALVLGGARCILSYSPLHARLLKELGYPCVHVVPLYSLYAPLSLNNGLSGSASLECGTAELEAQSDYDHDFTFFGGCSERRRRILMQVQEDFPQCATQEQRDAGHSAHGACFSYLLSCVGWDTGVFDNMRHRSVQRSRLVVNIHHDAASVLEVHRINYLLSMGKCVVSERSDDLLLDAQYERAVRFVDDSANLLETVTALLNNATALHECEVQARLMYESLSSNVGELGLALDHALSS